MNSFETGLTGFLLIQGLLLSFLFVRRKPHLCNFLIGLLILKFSLLMLNLLSEDSGFFPEIPIPMFLTGPLILLYIRKSRNGRRFNILELLLFLPVCLEFIPFPEVDGVLLFPVFDILWTVFLSTIALVSAIRWKQVENDQWYRLMPMLVLLSSLVSGFDLLFLFVGRMDISDFFSSFMTILEGGLIFVPAWYLLYRDRGIVAFENAEVIKVEASVKYEKNLLDESLLEIYYSKLQTGMEEEEWYKKPGLSLTELSQLVKIPVVHLSQLINRKEAVNFFQYLNRLRVSEACRLLKSGSNMTIIEIMFEAGFSSKSTFNTAFRAQTGKTPKEFRDSTG